MREETSKNEKEYDYVTPATHSKIIDLREGDDIPWDKIEDGIIALELHRSMGPAIIHKNGNVYCLEWDSIHVRYQCSFTAFLQNEWLEGHVYFRPNVLEKLFS